MPVFDKIFGRGYNDWLADCCGQEQKMEREFSESGEGVNVQIFSVPDQAVPADVSKIRVSPANQNRWVSHVFRTSSPPIGGLRKDTGSLVVVRYIPTSRNAGLRIYRNYNSTGRNIRNLSIYP